MAQADPEPTAWVSGARPVTVGPTPPATSGALVHRTARPSRQ